MTIRKGQVWGTAAPLPEGSPVVRTDAEARRLVEEAGAAGVRPPVFGLLGGDLCRTVGGTGSAARLRSAEAVHLPLDIAEVTVDGSTHRFVAHLVARRSWWRGRVVALMNAQWIGRWDVAPRSHPNDGLLDLFDADLSFDDRTKVRRRLLTGTHVPHPGITQRRSATFSLDLGRSTPIWLDGEQVTSGRHLEVRLEPDAATAVV